MSKAAQVSAQLVSLVNPRLALYTRAGFLAAIILAINFAIIVGLALVLQQDCTGSTSVDRSSPVTFGDFLTYEEFINTTLGREGVVKEDTTTTTTTVSGCVKRNSALLVAPFMNSLCTDTCKLMNNSLTRNGDCDDGGPGSEYDYDRDSQTQMTRSSSCPFGSDCADCGVRVPSPSYSGTGITADVPCWNQYVPCFQSTSPSPSTGLADCSTIPTWCVAQCVQYAPCLASGTCFDAPQICLPCVNYAHCYGYNSYGYDEEQNAASSFQAPCGWYRTSEAQKVGGPSYKKEMGPKADRFPWCSEEVHDVARRKYARHRNLTSMDKSSVSLAIMCGLSRMNGIPVSPGGVLSPNLSPAPGENLFGTMTSFTTHWSLTVTTKTTVCPKLSAAFSSALAYAAYIEIIITMVLVYVFKMCALIEDKKEIVDNGRPGGRKPVDLPSGRPGGRKTVDLPLAA